MRNFQPSTFHRTLVAVILVLIALAPFALTQNADRVIRIGYQKYGTLVLLKARGSLEKRLAPMHVEVKWTEFPAGPQLLEGLNVGSIDFSTVGEAPPFAAHRRSSHRCKNCPSHHRILLALAFEMPHALRVLA